MVYNFGRKQISPKTYDWARTDVTLIYFIHQIVAEPTLHDK